MFRTINAARIQSGEEVRAHGIIRVGAGREVIDLIFVPAKHCSASEMDR